MAQYGGDGALVLAPPSPAEDLPGAPDPMEVSPELAAEAASDLALAASVPLPPPPPAAGAAPGLHLPPVPHIRIDNPFLTPAFLEPGGGAHGAQEVATAGTTIEAGSVRELACRATAAVAALAALCACLGMGAAGSPWFGLRLADACFSVFSLTSYGSAGSCPAEITSQVRPFPRPFSEDAQQPQVQEALGTLGFAAFLMSCAIMACVAAAGVGGVMSFRLARGLSPHRHANAFVLVALAATGFTLSALAMMAGSARLLQALQSFGTPVLQAGHGSGDAMVVFMCAAMATAVVVKIRVRAAAVLAEDSKERGELEALLGTDPEGHFCL
jgi:hypothetical protein